MQGVFISMLLTVIAITLLTIGIGYDMTMLEAILIGGICGIIGGLSR